MSEEQNACPCPFACDGVGKLVPVGNEGGWRIWCDRCGAYGPKEHTTLGAIEAWNRRSSSAPQNDPEVVDAIRRALNILSVSEYAEVRNAREVLRRGLERALDESTARSSAPQEPVAIKPIIVGLRTLAAEDAHYRGATWEICTKAADILESRAASLPSSPTPIRCPICDGRGVVAYPPNTVAGQGWSSSSTGNYSCPLCKGAMIVQPSAIPSSPTAPPLNALAAEIHAGNKKWWFQADGVTPLARNKGELLMLVVTEVAEAMEGERKNLMDDKLPHRRMAEVEIVDAIVRLLDYAAGFGYELDDVLREKLAYNATRADHKAEAERLANGTRLIDSLPASAEQTK